MGLELHTVSSQPQAVQRSVNEFVRSLIEAVIIVLGVSLLSLGLRTGIVVAITIPVGAGHHLPLHADLRCRPAQDFPRRPDPGPGPAGGRRDHRRRDDVGTKLEQGWSPCASAACLRLRISTAFPMLTGTLVTVAGFLPIATGQASSHGRIHALHFPGVGHRADHLLVCRRGVRALSWLQAAAGLRPPPAGPIRSRDASAAG